MLNEYEINLETLLIMPDRLGSKIYEGEDQIFAKINVAKLIDNSCRYFGSSYEGRFLGSCSLISSKMKVPIVIEESSSIIFFPTSSIRNNKGVWISFNNLCKVEKYDMNSSKVIFLNGINVIIPVTYRILQNQIVRCVNLKRCLDFRKKNLQKKTKKSENFYY